MNIFIGSDHAGFELKQKLMLFLRGLNYEVKDMGAYQYLPDDDYPDFVVPVAKAVAESKGGAWGIVIGGSGQGEAIVANRFSGIRAIVFNGQYAPKDGREMPNEIVVSREHNDANILSLGARFLNDEEAKVAVKLWLETPFPGDGRHVRRIEKIDRIDYK